MLLGNGNCNNGGPLAGDIAEMLTFNRQLTESEKSQIESYLSIKYGITLNQSIPTNYTLS